MIESYNNDAAQRLLNERAGENAKPRKVRHQVKNERMAGTVPAWDTVKTPTQKIEQNLSRAQYDSQPSFKNALSFAGEQNEKPTIHQQEFGFADLIDMVNPLHHIPVLGSAYRHITGDEIKPIGRIMGGGLYGGVGGAASSLVGAMIEGETGHDLEGHVIAMAMHGEMPKLRQNTNAAPQERLESADQDLKNTRAAEDLPASLLGFTSHANPTGFKAVRIENGNERLAGSQTRISYESVTHTARQTTPREPITQVRLNGLYALAEK